MTHPAVGERVTHTAVNVDNAIQEGKKQMTLFESSWPAGFHTNISKVVTAMSVTKKHIKVGDTKGFNPEIIYARAMGLQSSTRPFDTEQVMCYELAPFPTSLFDETRNMRYVKSKFSLKNKLKINKSGNQAGFSNTTCMSNSLMDVLLSG